MTSVYWVRTGKADLRYELNFLSSPDILCELYVSIFENLSSLLA
jgi:hypothetical protein